MSKGGFVIYTLIYMGIAGLLAFKAGPAILNGGRTIKIKPTVYDTVEKIDFWYHKVGKEYINVKIIANNTPIELQFRRSKGTQKPLLEILKNNKLVVNEHTFLSKIPISLNKEELGFIKRLEVIYSKDKLCYVAINEKVVKGSKPTVRKIITIFLGYFVIGLSGLGLLLLPLGAYAQIKDNKESSTPIYVPNRLEGVKNFFRIFNKK